MRSASVCQRGLPESGRGDEIGGTNTPLAKTQPPAWIPRAYGMRDLPKVVGSKAFVRTDAIVKPSKTLG
jgi:hypothetical protein